jgi:GxxExxY protein
MNAEEPELNAISYAVIGAAQTVSRALGAGFLEKIYENALCWELRKRHLEVLQQGVFDVRYDGQVVGTYIPDIVVAARVIVEVKAVAALDSTCRAQCLNYLRATGLPLCLLLNFGRPRLEYTRFAMTS